MTLKHSEQNLKAGMIILVVARSKLEYWNNNSSLLELNLGITATRLTSTFGFFSFDNWKFHSHSRKSHEQGSSSSQLCCIVELVIFDCCLIA